MIDDPPRNWHRGRQSQCLHRGYLSPDHLNGSSAAPVADRFVTFEAKIDKTVSTAEGEGESEWRGGGEVGLERGDCKSDENGGKAPKTSIFIRFAEAEPQEEMHTPQRKNSARVFPDGVRLCQMLDLNQRRHKPADLQSASFGRSDNLAYTTWCAQYPTTRLKDSLNALLGPGIDVLKRKAEQPGYGGQPPNRNRTSPGGPARRPAGGAAPQ